MFMYMNVRVYVRKSVIMCMKMSELIIRSYSAFMFT